MIGQAEVEDFVGHQQDAVSRGLVAKEFEKAGTRRDHADAQRLRVHQDRGKIVFVLCDPLTACLQTIPRKDDDILGHDTDFRVAMRLPASSSVALEQLSTLASAFHEAAGD